MRTDGLTIRSRRAGNPHFLPDLLKAGTHNARTVVLLSPGQSNIAMEDEVKPSASFLEPLHEDIGHMLLTGYVEPPGSAIRASGHRFSAQCAHGAIPIAFPAAPVKCLS